MKVVIRLNKRIGKLLIPNLREGRGNKGGEE